MIRKILLNVTILSFTILFLNSTVNAQEINEVKNMYKTELVNGTWEINKIIGLDPNIKEYILIRFIKRKFAGNLISFKSNNIFDSRYVAPCGNDYFTTVLGKYDFFDKDKISISVDSISYSGEAEGYPTEYRKPKKILFKISRNKEKFILTQISD